MAVPGMGRALEGADAASGGASAPHALGAPTGGAGVTASRLTLGWSILTGQGSPKNRYARYLDPTVLPRAGYRLVRQYTRTADTCHAAQSTPVRSAIWPSLMRHGVLY